MTSVGSKSRRHGNAYYIRHVLEKVWRHPNNRGRRVRACGRAIGWQAYKRLVRRPLTVRAYDGLQVRCYPDSTGASNLIYFGSDYEYDEMAFLRRYIRPGDVVLDGGANIGTFSLFLASLVGAHGHVIALEPEPRAAARLRENVELNRLRGTVDVVASALSDSAGTAQFSTTWDVSNRLVEEPRADTPTTAVPTTTLDAVLDGRHVVRFAKLDLEGAEQRAILGASKSLRGGVVTVWMIEAIDWRVREAGGSRAELLELLATNGYSFAIFDARRARLEPRGASDLDVRNFLAIRDRDRDLVARRIVEQF